MTFNTVNRSQSPSVMMGNSMSFGNQSEVSDDNDSKESFFSSYLQQKFQGPLMTNIDPSNFEYMAPGFLASFSLSTPIASVSDSVNTMTIPYNGCAKEVQTFLSDYLDKNLDRNSSLVDLRADKTNFKVSYSSDFFEVRMFK